MLETHARKSSWVGNSTYIHNRHSWLNLCISHEALFKPSGSRVSAITRARPNSYFRVVSPRKTKTVRAHRCAILSSSSSLIRSIPQIMLNTLSLKCTALRLGTSTTAISGHRHLFSRHCWSSLSDLSTSTCSDDGQHRRYRSGVLKGPLQSPLDASRALYSSQKVHIPHNLDGSRQCVTTRNAHTHPHTHIHYHFCRNLIGEFNFANMNDIITYSLMCRTQVYA